MQVETVIIGVFGFWLLMITGFVFWIYKHISSLVKESKGEPLIKILDKFVEKERKNEGEIEGLKKELKILEEKGLLHIQKIGLIRFNPFNETGGDHSFSLAVLDANDTGFVLTGLHTRERTRLYTKSIKEGIGDHDLSKEELQAIKKAKSFEK
jgi:hypothetical protein